MTYRIGFAGTDGRSLLSALVVSTAISETDENDYQGVVIRGMPAMPPFARLMNWPVEFVSTIDNTKAAYIVAIIDAVNRGLIDCAVPMPEDLLLEGLVDDLTAVHFGNHIIGLTKEAAMMTEGDKIACKFLCEEYQIPVADEWHSVDANNCKEVLDISLSLIDKYGGAVFKFPYSAGGKGSRIILNAWEIREVYDTFIKDYAKSYKPFCI